ncbi:PTS transporter subunit EIIC [Halocella sp. SP3-1]|uniref:PTS sugar transporter subunit IIC n=1 Tax=Halocella sp. SP3-1 TaxID=2382161 RepID=UPI000F75209D|nr:PTS transporter subunit EIIC [Halocella sp. SP3-1]AZO94106.1 PTS sugar transporter subunit IIC [Halocella sp. SP3-1]
MQKFVDWMEENFAPVMNKINRNVWVLTLKDSIMQILPMILVGSLVTVLAILQDYIPNFPNLWTLNSYSLGLIALFIAFLLPFNFMERKKLHKMRLVGGMSGLALFMMVIKPVSVEGGTLFQFSYFGAGGMFVAIICGIFAALIMLLFGKFSFFKEDSAIPDFVRAWFDSMLPIALVIVTGWLFVFILDMDMYGIIQSVFQPITNFAYTMPGFMLINFLYVFLYSMGISTWVMAPITKPIFLTAITANAAEIITTSEVIFSGWIAIGGIGATLPLVIMLVLSKAKRLKALGTASLVPGILNINEPVVFGCIAWNPILMIPMWLQGIIIPAITYLVLNMGMVTIPSSVFDMWYCPFPFATWIVTQDFRGIILLGLVVAVSSIIWWPFFKIYEKQQFALEAETAKE